MRWLRHFRWAFFLSWGINIKLVCAEQCNRTRILARFGGDKLYSTLSTAWSFYKKFITWLAQQPSRHFKSLTHHSCHIIYFCPLFPVIHCLFSCLTLFMVYSLPLFHVPLFYYLIVHCSLPIVYCCNILLLSSPCPASSALFYDFHSSSTASACLPWPPLPSNIFWHFCSFSTHFQHFPALFMYIPLLFIVFIFFHYPPLSPVFLL